MFPPSLVGVIAAEMGRDHRDEGDTRNTCTEMLLLYRMYVAVVTRKDSSRSSGCDVPNCITPGGALGHHPTRPFLTPCLGFFLPFLYFGILYFVVFCREYTSTICILLY